MQGGVLAMTTSSDLQSMNGSKESTASDRESNYTVVQHSGLSALLSAVTLELNESNDEKQETIRFARRESRQTTAKRDHGYEDDNDDPDKKSPSSATTPTMMPEAHRDDTSTSATADQTVPQILMTLLLDTDNQNIITFLPDDKYFALQAATFASTLMERYFQINRWESFLEKLLKWGFVRIETNVEGVEVFRHPLFRKGDWGRCNEIKEDVNIGATSPSNSSSSSNNNNTITTTTTSSNQRVLSLSRQNSSAGYDDPSSEGNLTSENFKRRLSPAHAEKVTSTQTAKVRIQSTDDEDDDGMMTSSSSHSATRRDGRPSSGGTRRRLSLDDCRSLAVTIATEKLKLESTEDKEATKNMPLVSQAVFGATHTIVTDAIETLLRDEDHTRETFQKHADELSKSSLPGLVPISKQLFSKDDGDNKEQAATAVTGDNKKPSAVQPKKK
mmetsp:Transcript_24643/g.41918  ORF Transcript_24643/g.41918 Transcript_24643/m.41918 type:complete len:444 (-) Transcript_24643:272-1603(-)